MGRGSPWPPGVGRGTHNPSGVDPRGAPPPDDEVLGQDLGLNPAGQAKQYDQQHNHQAADVATVSLWLPCRDRDQCNDCGQLDADPPVNVEMATWSKAGQSIGG